MSKFVRGLALVVGLSLAIVVAARADEDTKKAQADILDLVKDLEGGKDVAAKVASIKKKYEDLNTLMHAYKPRGKGGIGTGPASPGDGIEIKILGLGKRALAKGTLEKEKDDLVKVGYINLALAKISDAYTPAKPKGGKGPKDWKKHLSDMEASSKALIEAAKKSDPAGVKKAAADLNNSCNNCHTDFRDN